MRQSYVVIDMYYFWVLIILQNFGFMFVDHEFKRVHIMSWEYRDTPMYLDLDGALGEYFLNVKILC